MRLEESVAAKQGGRAIRDRLFLAMAQHRLGRAAEAERTFDEATRRTSSQGADDRPISWPDRVEYEVLRREAEALILGSRRDGRIDQGSRAAALSPPPAMGPKCEPDCGGSASQEQRRWLRDGVREDKFTVIGTDRLEVSDEGRPGRG